MYNPLLNDPKKLKDSELDQKIQELGRKYHIAARMGYGAVVDQILAALQLHREEAHRRFTEAAHKAMKKQDRDLDDLINVD